LLDKTRDRIIVLLLEINFIGYVNLLILLIILICIICNCLQFSGVAKI